MQEDRQGTGPGREHLLITQNNFFFLVNDNICLLSKVLFLKIDFVGFVDFEW